MAVSSGLQSLFSQKLDRALFATYFLGAVVPLLAAGYLVQRFALPTLDGDLFATSVVLGSTLGITLLSLAAFFALRRLSLSAVARMDADNDRLATILEASRGLGGAPHAHAAAEIALGCALRLAEADAILLVRRPERAKSFEICDSLGSAAQRSLDLHGEELMQLAEEVASGAAPGVPQPLGESVAIALPMLAEGGAPGALIAVRERWTGSIDAAFAPEVTDALATLAGLTAAAVQGADLKDSQANFFTHATEMLVMALDAHTSRRAGGYHRIAQLANLLGRELGLDEDRLRRLHFASLLSDIGMLKLTPAQLRAERSVARHPVVGHRLLGRIRLWGPLAEIVLHHHDRYGGEESTDATRGESIPVESRIIHVADAFACLTWSGDSSMQLTPAGAVADLSEHAGSEYDPQVVAAFQRLVERGDVDSDA